jgi:hypothetical protein
MVMIDYTETKLDKHFKSLIESRDNCAPFDSLGLSYLVNYIDKKINRKVNNGI